MIDDCEVSKAKRPRCPVCGQLQYLSAGNGMGQNRVWYCDCNYDETGVNRMNAQARYQNACHAMQTGVKLDIERDEGNALRDPLRAQKHLRVGVNSAMVEHAALVRLLIEKGVFTEEEYVEHLAQGMEQEVKSYEERLGVKLA